VNSEWSWQAAPVSAPFAQAGRIGVNTDQPAAASLLYVHRLDSGGTDRSGNLMRLTNQNVIYLQQKTLASSWHRYLSTGRPVLNGDCWIIPVKTDVGSPAGTEPANSSPLLVTIPGDI
jgi:hypothetical protein